MLRPARLSMSFRAVAAMLVLATQLRAQSAHLYLDGLDNGTIHVQPAAFAVLDVVGPAAVPFALRIGFIPDTIPTPYGVLGLSPVDPGAFFLLDGYESWHPHYAISFLDAAGQATYFVIPFTNPEEPGGTSFHAQAYVTDPAAPAGAWLTNALEVASAYPEPLLSAAAPNYNAIGGTVELIGTHFASPSNTNVVTIGGAPAIVLPSPNSSLAVALSPGTRSGPILVQHSGGVSGGDPEEAATWCAVVTTLEDEHSVAPVIMDCAAILGTITLYGERDGYVVRAGTGDEIFAECYSWDPTVQRITPAANTVNSYFDPVLRILRAGVLLAEDDDSGPSTAAGIGLVTGTTYFVADQAADYRIEVSTFLGFGSGHYLLVLGRRQATAIPVSVLSVWPNLARPGDTVAVQVTGAKAGDIAGVQVKIGGVDVQVLDVRDGRIDISVPFGCVSGPVNVAMAAGSTSHPTDRIESWLCVMAPELGIEVEGQPQTIPVPGTMSGSLETAIDADTFSFNAVGGRHYRLEGVAWDGAGARVVSASFLSLSPLDPELRVNAVTQNSPLMALDGNSGPGFNALIGNGPASSDFIAPATGLYTVTLRSWFSISSGAYILTIAELAP